MSAESRKILVQYWGYSSFRPMQEDIIDSVLQKKDTLALLPTGGGKSICFQVPALMMDGTCLVITPLIALMKDQVDGLRKLGIQARAIYTGMHPNEIESVYNNCLNGKTKFLYVSPERLENEAFIHVISRIKINLITVDEAHCISQWGYDFRPPYLRIAAIRKLIPGIPVLAVTATATEDVVEDIMSKLLFKERNLKKVSFERKNLSYQLRKTSDKTGHLLQMMKKEPGSAIIYVRNRRKTKEISDILNLNKINSTYYHAGLDSKTRETRQHDWTIGRARVIVSTNAFGMGIDKPDVRQVIHIDLPDCIESYFQEAGRAGRDLKPAIATLLYNDGDIVNAKKRQKESFPTLDKIRNIYNALGNYFNVPVGSGKDAGYDFDITDFSQNYNFQVLEVYSAIKFLEREGYIQYIESAGQFSRLYIPLNKEELYKHIVENPASQRILQEILRSYSGVFNDYVNINETQLAKRAEIDLKFAVDRLTYLDKNKVISYIPIKTKPQLVYGFERQAAEQIQFSKENYDFLKNNSEKRLQAFLDLISNSLQCRSQLLLAYFGELKSKRCGICDVCLEKNKVDLNDIEFESIVTLIQEKLEQRARGLFELVNDTKSYNEDDVIAVIRWLLDNKKIIRHKDGILSWHKQLDLSFD
ncbi:MAG TPA: ATP-dependent DNA helicase RecQ [Bacteroidales bacterium]